jgi:hypothetical protein
LNTSVEILETHMSKLNSIQRLLGAGLALCAFSLPAAAQEAQQDAVQSTDSAVVTRDAATGKLRAATTEEQAGLQAAKARQLRVAPKATMQKFHANGARGARLTDEFLSSSVAVRNADGKIEMVCNEAHGGSEPVAAHVHAAAATLTPVTE